jgi:hypothetical protein
MDAAIMDTYPKMFGELRRDVSAESWIKIRELDTETDPERLLEFTKDCEVLMDFIRKPHGGDSSSPDTAEQRREAIKRLNALDCKDGKRNIIWLYERWTQCLREMTELGCQLPSEEDLLASYFDKLPAKFDAMREDWFNHKRLMGDSFPYPKTFARAYTWHQPGGG